MVSQNSMPFPEQGNVSPRPLNTPEFINRLADELRAHGDVDLPHSYYVEQVKLKLAGDAPARDEAQSTRSHAPYESSDCFRAWALGE